MATTAARSDPRRVVATRASSSPAAASAKVPSPSTSPPPPPRPATCSCGGSCPRCLQPKLEIDVPGDVWEREADLVADAVVEGSAPLPGLTPVDATAQRLPTSVSPQPDDAERGSRHEPGDAATADAADEDETDSTVQRLGAGAAAVPPGVESRLAHSGSGVALPAGVAAAMGERIGADFRAVRVHADAAAAGLCADLGARAFAHGAHLYFARGEYAPETREGQRTLAHELAHVVQQRAAPRAPRLQRMSALDRSDPGTLHDTDVRPWGGAAPSGDEYVVSTDAGTPLTAWVAYGGTPVDHRYWCHGFSLGTYAAWGYSVWSGGPMEKVVRDEYRRIPREQARAGDLAVWVLMPDGRLYGHSAKFTQPVLRGDGTLDTARSRHDTKNGRASLANRTLAEITAVPAYGYNVAVYRAK